MRSLALLLGLICGVASAAEGVTQQLPIPVPITSGGTGNTTGNAATVTGFSPASGKVLTLSNTLTLAGTDGSTLNVGAGGTLGTAAFAATGTSGGTLCLLNSSCTISGNWIDSGSFSFSGNRTYSGVSDGTNSFVHMGGSAIFGTATQAANGIISPFDYYISGDNVDTTTTGNGNLIGLSLLHAVSANHTGGREAVQCYLAVVGSPAVAAGTAGYVGCQSQVRISANLGGTTGAYNNYKGGAFGGNSNVFTTSGATFLNLVDGHEFDTAVVPGSSVADHFGVSVVETANHANRGVYDDSGISFSDQEGTTAHWLYGISFGSYAHKWPFAADSTLIGAQIRQVPSLGTSIALNGVDFRNVTFQSGGFAFASTGFTVDPSGNAVANAINSTPIGGSTASTGAFTTLSASSTVSGSGFSTYLASPPAIGGTAAAAGSFTTLSASSTVSGSGFSTYLASPPAIGGTVAAAITGTTVSATTAFRSALGSSSATAYGPTTNAGTGMFFPNLNQTEICANTSCGFVMNGAGLSIFQLGTAFSGSITTIGSATPATGATGELAFTKIAATGTAPGAAYAKMEWVCGTTAGSAKLIAYAGTSTTPVTIVDLVGSGVTGC